MTILITLGAACVLCFLAECVVLGIMFYRHYNNDNYPEGVK